MKKLLANLDKEKLRRNLRLAGLIVAAYVLVVLMVLVATDARHVRFYLVDGPEISTAYGKPFTDPGRYAVSTGRITGEGEKELPVETTGEVDTSVLGTYELQYTTRYHLRSYTVTRVVHVEDLTPPEITLEYREDYEPSWFTGYDEEGYTASDDYDGDVTARVESVLLEDRVEYTVSDAAGNVTTVERPLHYTVTRPEITLEGGEEVEIPADLTFTDPGYSATDSLGNDLTKYVKVEGEVIPYKIGSYERSYSISNELGETVSVMRTVNVTPAKLPEIVQPEGRVIYLTFDDGPGPYTARLLDILAKYDVKATFFVTCLNPDYAYLVGRAYSEGHSIGVHSATHNYYTIYASEQAFIDDFNEAEAMIYEQTGSYTRLFRFPGGSSNTVSSFNPGIMTRLVKLMTEAGYVFFDWNVTSGDAGETTKTSVVLDNVVGGCSGLWTSVVLQHDIKDFSVAAVERIISWGLRNGYTFLPLDMTSPNAHHGTNN